VDGASRVQSLESIIISIRHSSATTSGRHCSRAASARERERDPDVARSIYQSVPPPPPPPPPPAGRGRVEVGPPQPAIDMNVDLSRERFRFMTSPFVTSRAPSGHVVGTHAPNVGTFAPSPLDICPVSDAASNLTLNANFRPTPVKAIKCTVYDCI